ncbi:MAG: hypothetical protein WBA97_35240 [Actinophytocola sp.]|uniref:hypothetical protein n=1 Tax=Actinophytocola sp. TaxID=1872138 RepID=UPI003C73DA03
MISISFSLPEANSPWRKTWEDAKQGDAARIAEIDLRYKYFGVNVEMIVGDVEVISKKRVITLVDVALSLMHVEKRILSGEDAAFGFTESEEVVQLRRDGDRIVVTSSTRAFRTTVERGELANACSRFCRNAYSCLVDELPALVDNSTVQLMLPK